MECREYAIMYEAEERHFWYRALHRLLASMMRRFGPEGGGRVLDIGCGTGAGLVLLARDYRASGLDLAEVALGFCRKRRLARLARGSAMGLPFAQASFDGAVMMDVLYHQDVPDRRVPLREAARVLRPGGMLYLNLPAYQWLYSSHDVAVHTGHRFTRREAVGLLEQSGFEVVKATYWNTLLFPAIAAARLLRRGRDMADSDLSTQPSPLLHGLLGLACAAERAWLSWGSLPFGVSVFVAARRL